MKSRIFATFICMCLLCSTSSIPVNAATLPQTSQIGIQPFWSSTESITLTLSYSGGNANWTGGIQGKVGTTKITATFTLAKKNSNGTYTTLKTWTESSNSDILFTSGSYAVSSGSTYRISVTTTVTPKSGTSETVSDSMEKAY